MNRRRNLYTHVRPSFEESEARDRLVDDPLLPRTLRMVLAAAVVVLLVTAALIWVALW